MALRLGKVLNVVSSVASSAAKINSTGNMGVLKSITGGMKAGIGGGGLDLLSANNLLGSLTGIDFKKYLSLDSIGKVFNMDTDVSSLIPSDLSASSLMGDFDVNSIMSSVQIPTDVSEVTSSFGGTESEASNAISGAMEGISSQLTNLADFGSTDLFSTFGTGISLF